MRSRIGFAAAALSALIVTHSPVARAAGECSGPQVGELTCLACNIYYEARNQSDEGQLAVAMVTLNRLRSRAYPDTICGVVWESGRDYRTGQTVAQFSWTLQKRPEPVMNSDAWRKAVSQAGMAMRSMGDGAQTLADPSRGAMFFHASYVDPDWRYDSNMTFLTRIGDHLFYKTTGSAVAGAQAGFRPKHRFPSTMPVRQPDASPPSEAAGPHPDFPWVNKGAKLIRFTPGGTGNAVRVTSYERGRVNVVTVKREGS